MEELKTNIGISDDDLDTRVLDSNIPVLSMYFDNTDHYIELFGLSPGQHTDVNEEKSKATLDRTEAGMKLVLKYWIKKDPANATYRSLLKHLISIRKGDIAIKVCEFIHSEG